MGPSIWKGRVMEWIKQHRGLAAALAGLAVVGALWAGMPAGTLLVVAFLLACPLMMLTMHGGGGHGGHGGHGGEEREPRPDPRRSTYSANGNSNGPTEADPHAAHRHPTDARPW
jgi:hypothetical protein